MLQRNFRALLAGLFWIQILILPISVNGGVICVSDTHVAIEFEQTGDVCHAPEMLVHLTPHGDATFHHTECADIPLLQHEKNILTKNIAKSSQIVNAARCMGQVLQPSDVNHGLRSQRPVFEAPATRLLKNMILLI